LEEFDEFNFEIFQEANEKSGIKRPTNENVQILSFSFHDSIPLG